jgi:hypothetical protein
LQISCKLSLAHPVTQSWKHLAPDNIEYYRSSSAHVRTWLLSVLQTKHLAHTHTHGENNLQNNTHTINRRNISPNPSIRSRKNNNKSFLSSYLAFRFSAAPRQHTTSPAPPPPPPPPLLLILLTSDSQTDDHKSKQKQTTTKAKKKREKRHRNQVLPEAVVVGLWPRVAVMVSHETRGKKKSGREKGKRREERRRPYRTTLVLAPRFPFLLYRACANARAWLRVLTGSS